MHQLRPSAGAVAAVVVAFVFAGHPGVAASQSLLERPPNLSGGWLGTRGTLQFNFVHRFGVSSAPLRKVTNSPTFLLAYQLPLPLLIGFNYATSSDVAPVFPNEWEAFARYARSGVALQVGYNQAARSADAELTASRRVGALRVMAIGRFLSNGYASDTVRYAAGGGATLRLTHGIALAGDVTTLLDRRSNEEIAWGAGLHVSIPYSPHTFSLQVTNTNTATLQGASRGVDRVRGGFEFTIPFTLRRYFGGGQASGRTVTGTTVEMRQQAFVPSRLGVSEGATVEWVNRDDVVHTVTADDGSWDSGPIEPGATWRHTFERAGDHPFHCTPHPFMKGAVVVRQP